MYVEKAAEKDDVLETVWLTREQREQLEQYVVATESSSRSSTDRPRRSSAPMNLPWSQGFYLSCQDVCGLPYASFTLLIYHLQIRSFVQNFYQFIEGVSQHHRNIDDLLSRVRSPAYSVLVQSPDSALPSAVPRHDTHDVHKRVDSQACLKHEQPLAARPDHHQPRTLRDRLLRARAVPDKYPVSCILLPLPPQPSNSIPYQLRPAPHSAVARSASWPPHPSPQHARRRSHA